MALLAASQGGFFARSWLPAGLAFAAAAGLLLLRRKARRLPARRAIIFVAGLVAIASWVAASATWSVVPDASLRESGRMALYVMAAAACVVAGTGLVRGLVVAATLVGGFAIGDTLAVGSARDPFEGSLLSRPLGYANALGILVGMASVACVVQALRAKQGRGVTLAPLVILIPALVLTGSRGAWVAGAAGVVVGRLLVRERTRLATAFALLCVATLAVFLATPFSGLGERRAYWAVARASVAERPLVGTGAGSYGTVYAASDLRSAPTQDAHSLYLESLDELGVVGLLLVLGTLAMPLVHAVRTRGSPAAPAVAVYVAFLLHAGIDWDWEMPAVTIAGLAAGISILIRDGRCSDSANAGTQILVPSLRSRAEARAGSPRSSVLRLEATKFGSRFQLGR